MASGDASNLPSTDTGTTSAVPKITERLDALAKRRLDRLEGKVTEFQSAITDIGDKWKKSLTNLLSNPTSGMANAGEVQDILYLQGEVLGQLKKLGFNDLAKRYVNQFDEQKTIALETVKALGVDSTRLGPLDDSALQTMKNLNVDWLDNLGVHASGEIARGVMMSTLAGASRSDLIQNVALSVDAKLVNYASTYADTALATYDREANWQVFKAAGVDKFVYVGPKDLRKRPFCLNLLGKTYTTKQIAAMNNGTRLMPVAKFGGGWNCRDIWMPSPETPAVDKLTKKLAERAPAPPAVLPVGVMSVAEATDALRLAETAKANAYKEKEYWAEQAGQRNKKCRC